MNKKLIKTIASITCGLGVVGTIPAITSSCGGQSEPTVTIETTILPLTLASNTITLTSDGDYFSGTCGEFNVRANFTSIQDEVKLNFSLINDKIINRKNERVIYHSLKNEYIYGQDVTDQSVDLNNFFIAGDDYQQYSACTFKINNTDAQETDCIENNIWSNKASSMLDTINRWTWEDLFPSHDFSIGDKFYLMINEQCFQNLQTKPIGIPVQKITIKY